MHEMAIVQSIMEIVEQQAALHNARRVVAVSLEFGALTGVMSHAVEFAFQVLSQGGVAQGAELHIMIIPLKGYCSTCAEEFVLDAYQPFCPQCSSTPLTLVQGRDEMRIASLEIEDSQDSKDPPA
jgi:hydrogenase nickel incorporation protein HypA/HybF